jgi:hypothetical protein
MGLDTIVFEAAGAGAMAALAPTSAVIRNGSGDAYIVGVAAQGVTLERVTLTSTDARWEAAGFRNSCGGNGAAAGGCPNHDIWLPAKVPIARGATLTATQAGAGEGFCLVYIEYPDIGTPFKPRDPWQVQPKANLVSKLVTAGGALVALTITVNSTNDATFVRGRTYTPVKIACVTGGTGPEIAVGIQNVDNALRTFWFIPITEVLSGSDWHCVLPYGLSPVGGGDTQYFHFVSNTTDTPAVEVTYAYNP